MVIGSLSGVIRGRTIELDGDAGMPDGTPVRVVVQSTLQAPGDGVRRSIGGWLTDEDDEGEFQAWLAETYRLRDAERRESAP